MKQNIRSWALVGAGCACLTAWSSPGQSQGFYFNTDIGVALADEVKLNQYFGPTGGTKLDFDTGVRLSASGGFNFNPFLGIEAETGLIYNSVKGVVGGGGIDASLSHFPMMINAVVRYDQPRSKWVPYAGVGAGGDASVITLNNVGGNNIIADGSDTTIAFAWQAFAGLRYRLNRQMSVGAGYKYYSVDSASWDFAGFTDSIKIGRANVHSVLFEFNMKF